MQQPEISIHPLIGRLHKKPLLHGCVSFHVAAVYAVVIQLKFQKDRLEFMNLMPLPMINIFLSFS